MPRAIKATDFVFNFLHLLLCIWQVTSYLRLDLLPYSEHQKIARVSREQAIRRRYG
jgi:hypothetical protein